MCDLDQLELFSGPQAGKGFWVEKTELEGPFYPDTSQLGESCRDHQGRLKPETAWGEGRWKGLQGARGRWVGGEQSCAE